MDMMDEPPQTDLTIGGVKVKFPFKPYPSQLSLMSMIIRGLQNEKHCLLESPTGSGKSLALLCSALAWQKDYREKLNDTLSSESLSNVETDCCGNSGVENESEEKDNYPKIWFGTRTHKQVAQITHELARTAYKSVEMTILSSREHSCIHPVNKNSKTKNDGCRDLLKGRHPELPGTHCGFYQNVHRMKTHHNLKTCGLTSAWDLEDLVKLGNRLNACPYYSTRELLSTASIIFCPYNYLIDPAIRSQMQINLSNQIVILDEAHNVEDSAREAASFTVNEIELANTIADLDHLIAEDIKVDDHKCLHLLCTKVGQWIHNHLEELSESGFETWSKIWTGPEFSSHLEEWGITADTLPLLKTSFGKAMDNKESEEESPPMLHTTSQSLLGGLFQVLANLFVLSQKYAPDYRISVVRSANFGVPPPKRTREGWISVNKRKSKFFSVNLHFWCLNPAVAFSHLDCTRSVVLTSGTLSPMSSFSSELGVSFPIQLEAPHVIPDSQVWVGSIGFGPGGRQLQATYQNTNSFDFQDELGSLLSNICCIIPNGVLCFFSSYKMLEKMVERWKNTGIWYEIENKKHIFSEPHGRNKIEFDDVLQSFYESVSPDVDYGVTGALLLAVCRGKVSEGLDFSDKNARAVITVGIPFPNFKDKQVELKRKYNDTYAKQRGLLTGSDWYEIQAYRALNQALGRCIRHRNDWGALIIVDNRFCTNPKKYCKGLSKWVRQKVNKYSQFSEVKSSLEFFCQAQNDRINNSRNQSISDTTLINETKVQSSSKIRKTKFSETNDLADWFSPCNKSRQASQILHNNKIKHKNNSGFVGSNIPLKNETPEKKRIMIVPESPEIISSDEEDFQPKITSTVVPRNLSRKVRGKPSILEQQAKKCKISQLPTTHLEEENTIIEDHNSDEESEPDSFELLNKGRNMRKTNTFSYDRKIVKDHHCHCVVCNEKLFSLDGTLKPIANTYKFVLKKFPKSKLIYSLIIPLDHVLLKPVSYQVSGITLNTTWCEDEKLCYMFYQCLDCGTVVAFTPMSQRKPNNLFVFICSVTVA